MLYPYAKNLVANEEKIFVTPRTIIQHLKKNQSSRHASLLNCSNYMSGNLVQFNYYAGNFEIFCFLVIELEKDDASVVAAFKKNLITQENGSC